MEKIYYVGQCPICCSYGRLEIDKDVTNSKYIVICEECLAEWKNPQDALENINGRRCPANGEVRSATFDEIKNIGWDKFVTNIEE
ncbi:hypothetical protein AALB52_25750 [Lachnospiraceae bacterium 38-14]|jgi:hypothetical protein|uniref:hypothetical protein n=1 Tax=Roseburia sp. 1XD42-69 TaxID=2320088 RepID=UPI000EA1B52B|nr:hypothetical protein [Roseburia sp. 1XD42-69]MDE6903368.1 hypothetical protein [Lachnospiraceae bacterium]MDE6981596.1 hypothetical protein [Lachnospiraceae bacterium]RKJ60016.1 hypothetical protein D7Y06_25000 [Roseburia sp. 1XD42-69]